MKASWKKSMLSQIVMMLVIATIIMQVAKFMKTGEVMDIFKSLLDMALGAYFQKSLSNDLQQDDIWQNTTYEK